VVIDFFNIVRFHIGKDEPHQIMIWDVLCSRQSICILSWRAVQKNMLVVLDFVPFELLEALDILHHVKCSNTEIYKCLGYQDRYGA
jgi:hypothetical protein